MPKGSSCPAGVAHVGARLGRWHGNCPAVVAAGGRLRMPYPAPAPPRCRASAKVALRTPECSEASLGARRTSVSGCRARHDRLTDCPPATDVTDCPSVRLSDCHARDPLSDYLTFRVTAKGFAGRCPQLGHCGCRPACFPSSDSAEAVAARPNSPLANPSITSVFQATAHADRDCGEPGAMTTILASLDQVSVLRGSC